MEQSESESANVVQGWCAQHGNADLGLHQGLTTCFGFDAAPPRL
jgi:hypothetical protein